MNPLDRQYTYNGWVIYGPKYNAMQDALKRGAHRKYFSAINSYYMERNLNFLIKSKIDINTTDYWGRTPLYYAVKYNEKALPFLLNAGADVNKVNNEGNTPLHEAVDRCSLNAIGLLLNAGADVNMVNNEGNTPLLEAVGRCAVIAIRFLLNAGADVNKANKKGETPVSLAIRILKRSQMDADRFPRFDALKPQLNIQAINVLLEFEPDVNKADEFGVIPLTWAAHDGHAEIVKLLLVAGTKVDQLNKQNRTPLHWAARNNHKEIVKLLLNAGADIDIKDELDETPLSVAKTPEVRKLLETRKTAKNAMIFLMSARRGGNALNMIPLDLLYSIRDYILGDELKNLLQQTPEFYRVRFFSVIPAPNHEMFIMLHQEPFRGRQHINRASNSTASSSSSSSSNDNSSISMQQGEGNIAIRLCTIFRRIFKKKTSPASTQNKS